jgi:hypothetical protein
MSRRKREIDTKQAAITAEYLQVRKVDPVPALEVAAA